MVYLLIYHKIIQFIKYQYYLLWYQYHINLVNTYNLNLKYLNFINFIIIIIHILYLPDKDYYLILYLALFNLNMGNLYYIL